MNHFSVILTSFNYASYIEQAIRSVFAQELPASELIIVDDGSTDDSRDIIEATIRNSPIPTQVLYQKQTEGQGNALNVGFERISGDVVCLLDSDDYWYPGKLACVQKTMELFAGGAVYQHQLDVGDGKKRGGMLSADLFSLWQAWDAGDFNIADDYTLSIFSPFVPTSGLVFPRAVIDKIIPIPSSITASPDAFMTRTAIAFGGLISIPKSLGHWRDHECNLSKSQRSDFKQYWLPEILPALNRFYAEHHLGLRLSYDPPSRSAIPASLMLGEYRRLQTSARGSSVKMAKMAEMASTRQKPSILGRIANHLRKG